MLSRKSRALFIYCILSFPMHISYLCNSLDITSFFQFLCNSLCCLMIGFHLSKYYLFSIIHNRISPTITWWALFTWLPLFRGAFLINFIIFHDTLSWLFSLALMLLVHEAQSISFKFIFHAYLMICMRNTKAIFFYAIATIFSYLVMLILSVQAFFLNAQQFALFHGYLFNISHYSTWSESLHCSFFRTVVLILGV